MSIKVVQWGAGNVGHHALRGVLERPELELVGLRVFNPAKVGVDAGELFGIEPLGVRGTDRVEDILALDADVVLYNALGTTLVDLQGPVDEICALLESGKNVISSAIDLFLYWKPGIAPKHVAPAMIEQIERACRSGGTSVYSTGMTPGFALDLWPMLMGRTCRRVDSVHLREFVSLRDYRSSTMPFMGFGEPADLESPMFKMFHEANETPYAGALHFVGDAFGVDIDEIAYRGGVITADEPVTCAQGTFAPGTVVGIAFRFSGLVDGSEFVTMDFEWRVDDDRAGWPHNLCAWELEIAGDPAVRSRTEYATPTDARRATSISVASHCLNAIPKVVAAPPGILTHFDVPIFTGRASSTLRPVPGS